MSKSTSAASALYRLIPSTDKCLEALQKAIASAQTAADSPDTDLQTTRVSPKDIAILSSIPRSLLRTAVTEHWDTIRKGIQAGTVTKDTPISIDADIAFFVHAIAERCAPHLLPVINGTGVVIHTNTGRSVLAREAREALQMAASGAVTLEFDRTTGGRGSRNDLLKDLLIHLTGAEDAIVVNNNAAAVLLVMDTFCKGGEAVISRGELVEIGGSFRIPDVMTSTGVILREVGATNRTHLKDYEQALGETTRAIVRVHTSNFRVIGFHTAVDTEELAHLAHERGILLINDLGSGSLIDFSPYGLPAEPTVQESLRKGSDLVLFSGDKLLGGPQAGIIAGRADLVARLRSNPLLRALRLDKLVYAALEATLRLYYDSQKARQAIPTLRMLCTDSTQLKREALRIRAFLKRKLGARCTLSLQQSSSRAGGGAFPEAPLPTWLVCIKPAAISAEELKHRLLHHSPIVIGRLEQDAFCIDPRTLLPGDLPRLSAALDSALGSIQENI